MISLDEYKTHLINLYSHGYDSSEIKRVERKRILESNYGDDYLLKIINDTYSFIKDLINSDTIEKDYYDERLENDNTSYIFLNLIGGWYSDIIYTDSKGRLISNYIITKTFGKRIHIGIREVEHFFEDDDIVGVYYDTYLSLQGFSSDLDDIKNNLFNNSKVLKK